MFFPGYGPAFPGGTFEQNYHVYPVSFIDKPHLENGDKVIMPPSALDRLASLHIDYPMLFEVENPAANRKSHCGVLEFIADEGIIYMPYWMMQNLLLQEGDLVRLKSATLSKGTYVKLQPHTKDFLDISNPKAVLETTLRNFSCLTVGDNIMVAYNNKKYYIDIVEAKPSNAISIIETDCEVDFAPPLDYKEPERVPVVKSPPVRQAPPSTPASSKQSEEAQEPEKPRFLAFVGPGRRLDGKPAKPSDSPNPTASSSPTVDEKSKPGPSTAAGGSANSGQSGVSRNKPGRLIFGGGNTGAPPSGGPGQDSVKASSTSRDASKEKGKEKEKEPVKEDPKFQAFTGKKFSLRD